MSMIARQASYSSGGETVAHCGTPPTLPVPVPVPVRPAAPARLQFQRRIIITVEQQGNCTELYTLQQHQHGLRRTLTPAAPLRAALPATQLLYLRGSREHH